MDKNEMLYEISLKYNTLKMYENTLEQMRKNGFSSKESIEKIEKEKSKVENELIELLKPNIDDVEAKNASIDNGNKFIHELKKKEEYKKNYDSKKNFFVDLKPLGNNTDYVVYRNAEIPENKKPIFSDIQEKISNSQWISCSNFIVRFPKEEIDIDSWRVSGFYYKLKQNSKCLSNRSGCERGEISVIVNDFAEKRENGTYNILSKIIEKLYKYKITVLGDIFVDVINNSGELLYILCFTKCIFNGANPDAFSYESTDLRKFYLDFTYDNVHVLAPDEKLSINETAD